jgi:hypothetical protein
VEIQYIDPKLGIFKDYWVGGIGKYRDPVSRQGASFSFLTEMPNAGRIALQFHYGS